MSIQIHILNSTGIFNEYELQIQSAIKTAFEKIQRTAHVDKIDVIVQHQPSYTIPEIGVGGFAPDAHTIYLSLDTDFEDMESVVDTEIANTIAHETHHCMRWRGPGYGQTLFEAMLTEGLADHFQMEVTGSSAPLWANHLSKEQMTKMLKKSRPLLDTDYDHDAWFFGSEEKGIHKWTGYTLGYQIAKKYLQKTGKRPSDIFEVDPREVRKTIELQF